MCIVGVPPGTGLGNTVRRPSLEEAPLNSKSLSASVHLYFEWLICQKDKSQNKVKDEFDW